MEEEGRSFESLQQTFNRSGLFAWDAKYGFLLKSGQLSDVTLKAISSDGEKSIRAHKWILRLSSDYFEKAFFGSLSATDVEEYPIVVRSVNSFELFLKLLYCHDMKFDSIADAIDLYILADEYLSAGALDFCRKYLTLKLNANNMGNIFTLAVKYKEKALEEMCRKVWRTHTKQILTNGSLDAVDLNHVAELFKEEVMKIDGELNLFSAILNNKVWLKGDSTKLTNLLKTVRFLTFDLETFVNIVAVSGLLSSDLCLAIICHLNSKFDNTLSILPIPDGFSVSQVDRGRHSATCTFEIFKSVSYFNPMKDTKKCICIMLSKNMYLFKLGLYLPVNEFTHVNKIVISNDSKKILYSSNINTKTEIHLNKPVYLLKNTLYFIIADDYPPEHCDKMGSFLVRRNVRLDILTNCKTIFSYLVFKFHI